MSNLSKGDMMRLLGMTTGVDSALPHPFVDKMFTEHKIEPVDILSNFVMDYREGNWAGTLRPITLHGLDVLDQINNCMGWDIPKPDAVVDPYTGEVWARVEDI